MKKLTFAEGVDRLRVLAQQDSESAWESGDIALALVPMGDDGVKNGSGEKLGVLAEAAGLNADHLRLRRTVSHTFPPGTRVPGSSWTVYRELLGASAKERERLIQIMRTEEPGTKSGRWTVSAVRERMNLETLSRVPEAVSEAVRESTTEEQGALYQALGQNPQVREAVRQDEKQREADGKARQSYRQATSPEPLRQIGKRLQALQGHIDLEHGMTVLLSTVRTHLPSLAQDPGLATRSSGLMHQVQQCRAALDQIERVLTTGKESVDADDFLRRLLSEQEHEA